MDKCGHPTTERGPSLVCNTSQKANGKFVRVVYDISQDQPHIISMPCRPPRHEAGLSDSSHRQPYAKDHRTLDCGEESR